jgi:hypothetical protein
MGRCDDGTLHGRTASAAIQTEISACPLRGPGGDFGRHFHVDRRTQMAQLQEENQRLKRLVADLTLDKTMLQDVLSKKW